MKISKFFVSSIIAATIIVSACIVASAASGTTGACTWTTSGTTLTISGTGAMADYTNGGAPWYAYNSSITSIVIGAEVTYIGGYSFTNFAKVSTITIPENIKGIGESAFLKCTGLTTLNFNPNKCAAMGSELKPVFEKCNSLININIGDNVKYIPEYAFEMCTAVPVINVPESVYCIRVIQLHCSDKCCNSRPYVKNRQLCVLQMLIPWYNNDSCSCHSDWLRRIWGMHKSAHQHHLRLIRRNGG